MIARSFYLLVALTTMVIAQNAVPPPALSGCGQTCFDNMGADASRNSLVCPLDGKFDCLCAKPDFKNGIHDCATTSCAADLVQPIVDSVNAFCFSVTAASAAPTAPTTTPTAPTTPSTTAPTSVPVSETTPTSAPTTPVTTPTSSPTSSAGTVSAASTSPSSAATTSNAPASSTTTPAAAAAASPGGMSQSTKIGVGVGVSVGSVAIIALIAFFIITRRHRNTASKNGPGSPRPKISDPLPGSGGRTYAGDYHNMQYSAPPMSAGSGSAAAMSELESKSKRYEDMVPRQSPRTMV